MDDYSDYSSDPDTSRSHGGGSPIFAAAIVALAVLLVLSTGGVWAPLNTSTAGVQAREDAAQGLAPAGGSGMADISMGPDAISLSGQPGDYQGYGWGVSVVIITTFDCWQSPGWLVVPLPLDHGKTRFTLYVSCADGRAEHVIASTDRAGTITRVTSH